MVARLGIGEFTCPACGGDGQVQAPFCQPTCCPWCDGKGKLTELPANVFRRGFSSCCAKAVELPRQCVCIAVTWCPQHGRRHLGTHD